MIHDNIAMAAFRIFAYMKIHFRVIVIAIGFCLGGNFYCTLTGGDLSMSDKNDPGDKIHSV